MADKRQKSGILTGVVGLVLNVFLGAGKLAAGLLTGSVSILSDAANNLSDAGSSVMTVFSFALGGRAADRDHPYGHGRYEYIASMLIGVIIVAVGVQLVTSSISKIAHPVRVEYNALAIAVLAVSVAVKLGMGGFYLYRAKKIRSDTLKAAAFDSFSDVCVTGGLIVTIVMNRFVAYPLEGVVGLVISLIIIFGGIKLLLSTVNRLLGRGADDETVRMLTEIVLDGDLIVGVHDLRVHDYGPNRKIASIHAEFDRNVTITEAHEVIDALEHKAYDDMGVELVIHCDPIDSSDVTLNRIRHAIDDIIRVYPGASIHDLDIHYAEHRVDLHLSIPEAVKHEAEHIRELIEGAVAAVICGCEVNIVTDIIYGQ